MIFVDNYSGCAFTYFLKEKSDGPKRTQKFADVNPYGKVKTFSFHANAFPAEEIETMQIDNGCEYILWIYYKNVTGDKHS